MSQRLDKLLSRIVKKVRDERVYGVLGRTNADATVTISVAERPDNVYITMDSGTIIDLPNKGKGRVPLRAGLPVQMLRHFNGDLVLDGQDDRLLENDNGDPSNPYAVPAHTHGTVGLEQYFVDLNDVPATYTGESLKLVRVNAAEDGLEFVTNSSDVATAITAASTDDTIIDADIWGYLTGGVLVKTAWSNIKAVLKTYFDTLYELAGAIATHAALTVTHGATGAVVGTTNSQALTNKTLDSTNISGLTAKNPPIDADSVVIVDSAASSVFKAVTFTNIKAFLVTYLSTLYVLLAGKAGGQTINGGTASGEDLTLDSTAHATKGDVLIQPSGGLVAIGGAVVAAIKLTIYDAAVRFRMESTTNSQTAAFVLAGKGGSGTARSGGFYFQPHETTTENFFGFSADNSVYNLKTYPDRVAVRAGAQATREALVGGVLFTSLTAVGNVGAGDDLLLSYTLPANLLAINGQSVWFEIAGYTANNVNAKSGNLKLGGATLGSYTFATSAENWYTLRGRLFRLSSTSVRCTIDFSGRVIGSGTSTSVFFANPSPTLSGTVDLAVYGTGVSNNDVIAYTMIVGFDDVNA